MPQATRQDPLRDAFKNHKILVDTCFLMHRNFKKVLDNYLDDFRNNHILIPRKVVRELQRIGKKEDHRLKAVRNAQRSLECAVLERSAEIRGEQSDDHTAIADHVISRWDEQHITHHSILVLTNDRALKDWIYAMNRAGRFSSNNSLLVARFGPQNGTPHIWGPDKGLRHNGHGQRSVAHVIPPRPRSATAASLPQSFARTNKLECGLAAAEARYTR